MSAATYQNGVVRGIGDPVYDFYCARRCPAENGGPPISRYEVWERGKAVNDSVTPSTYCPAYRAHMVLKIASLAGISANVFSIGCGNAFVEADLVARGYGVEAIDCNAEAVALAAAKGVRAEAVDYWALPAGRFANFAAIYADGLLGHVYRPEGGLDQFFETLAALRPSKGAWLVFSNDAPLQNGSAVAPNESVNGFWLLSRGYLEAALHRYGFSVWESYSYPYERPLSGLRNRTICVARVVDSANGKGAASCR